MIAIPLCYIISVALAVWFTIIEPAAVNSAKRKDMNVENEEHRSTKTSR